MSEVKNIPKLRFPEFSDLWMIKNLESLSNRIGDGLHGTPSYVENSEYYFINGNNLSNGSIIVDTNTKKVSEVDYNQNDKGLCDRSLLISLNGTIGSISRYNNEKVMLGKSVGYINFIQNSNFYYFQLQTSKIQNHFISELTGSTIKNLSLKTLRKTNLSIPSLPEQQKIADFLTAVDKRIELLEKKKTLLETYKKGVMKKIFNQEIRFKDDNGNDFPDWEEKRLGDVSECLDNERKPLNDSERQNMKGDIPYWGANNIMDYINEYIFNEPIVLLAEDGGNFNDFNDRPIANYYSKKCWVNNHTHVLKGRVNLLDTKFLFFSVVHKNIIGFVSGGTRSKLTKSEMLKIPLGLPCLMEQKRISEFLSSIDNQIELLETQIDKSKTWKKGLLQKMFV